MMKTAKTARTVILATLGWSFAECSGLGPNRDPPHMPVSEHYAATPSSGPLPEADGVRQQLDVGARPVTQWWIELGIDAEHSPFQSVVGAAVRRFRPITLTVAAAVLGLIPLPASNFFGPMATVLMGGITVATVLTIVFLPALYALWFRVRRDEDPSAAAGVAEQAAPA